MEFLAATNNRNKLEELRRILGAQGHTVLSLADVGLQANPVEDGASFEENATKKAREVCALSQRPTLADDSGLVVDALHGGPGVHSARFAGEGATDEENNQKLLRLLELTPYAKRTARFVSVVALVLPSGASIAIEGSCEGLIGFAPAGENGFGYDPLFYVNNKSFGEMTDEEKDAISHRAGALRRLVQELPRFVGKNAAAAAPPPAVDMYGTAPPAEEADAQEPQAAPSAGEEPPDEAAAEPAAAADADTTDLDAAEAGADDSDTLPLMEQAQ